MTADPLRIRPPAVAGMFYPEAERPLVSTIDRFLGQADQADRAENAARAERADVGAPADRSAAKAIIVPHAGYVYSGAVAARAYARWRRNHAPIERVIVLGPAHRVAVRSMALSSADAWQTPLGLVPIDRDGCEAISGMDGVVTDDRPHAPEHSLEVQVPFLQRVIPHEFSLLPIVVGHAAAAEVADVLERVWGGDETRIVISSDLSHYHDHDVAAGLDRTTAAAIVARSSQLDPTQACGAYPVQGLLETARRRDLTVELIDLRNSGDTAGPRDRVVGYGAFAVG